MALDRIKLAKLMEMTTSKAVGERLNAINLANEFITKEKLTWTEILTGPKVHEQAHHDRNRQQPDQTGDAKWDSFARRAPEVSAWILKKRDSFDFAESLYHGIRKYGGLTDKQFSAAKRCMARDADQEGDGVPPPRQTRGRGRVHDPYPDRDPRDLDDDIPF